MSVEERRQTLDQLNMTISSIRDCSKPTIAAVEVVLQEQEFHWRWLAIF